MPASCHRPLQTPSVATQVGLSLLPEGSSLEGSRGFQCWTGVPRIHFSGNKNMC